jgi:hypothetical protein
VAACHTRLADNQAGPQPGEPVQPRKWPTAGGGGAGHAIGADTAHSSRGGALTGASVVAGRWHGAADELAGAIGRSPGKAVGGGAHPNGGAVWRRWRSLETMVFVAGERALVAGGD